MEGRDRVRSNHVQLPLQLGTQYMHYSGGIYTSWNYVFPSSTPGQAATDYHRCIDETHPGPPYRSGGSLDVRHFRTTFYDPVECNLSYTNYPNIGYSYKGGFVGQTMPHNYLDWVDINDPILADGAWCNPDWLANGVKGWASALPAQPIVDLSVALGEAREIPQMLAQTAKSFAKSWARARGKRGPLGPKDLADDWLNANFGWKPFITDCGNLLTAVIENEAYIQQLRKDNDKWVYRRRSIRREEDIEQVYAQNGSTGHLPALATSLYKSPIGNTRIERRTTLNVWFVGRFKYYIPYLKTEGLPSTKEALFALGLNPSPITLYELMPWSWLIDWFSNFGDNLKIINDFSLNNCVAKYAYVMSHKLQRTTAEYTTYFKEKTLTSIATAECEQKFRMPASPLGFGLNPSGFTNYQWSILGALGFSKNKTLAMHG